MDKRLIKVLIVDDEKVVRDFLVRLLSLQSLEVKAVEDGFKAIEAAEGESFDLVFLDARMPKMNGLEVFKELKKINPGSKYVMMTGYAIDDLLEQANKEGAIISLKKPFEIEEILALVKTVSSP